MAFVELSHLTKRYGDVAVVSDVSLSVDKGLLVCLLGPSGCGKTTTLRLVAGFIDPDEGTIAVGGRTISRPGRSEPPERRNMSMIFQSYALWPHMTVFENVAYGLRLRNLANQDIKRRVESILSVTRLAPLAERYPSNWELSAARAINVSRYLQKQGIEPAHLSAAAFGEFKPVADNATPEGRAKNRRIEIVLEGPGA